MLQFFEVFISSQQLPGWAEGSGTCVETPLQDFSVTSGASSLSVWVSLTLIMKHCVFKGASDAPKVLVLHLFWAGSADKSLR